MRMFKKLGLTLATVMAFALFASAPAKALLISSGDTVDILDAVEFTANPEFSDAVGADFPGVLPDETITVFFNFTLDAPDAPQPASAVSVLVETPATNIASASVAFFDSDDLDLTDATTVAASAGGAVALASSALLPNDPALLFTTFSDVAGTLEQTLVVTFTAASDLVGLSGSPASSASVFLDLTVAAVPLPPALLLLGTAFAGLGFVSARRNRRKKAVRPVTA